ncbi:MAG: 5'-nucleotidase, lipoprotein e(P4) family [Bacteroidales bacterium]|nr:5'-nucleotidase, lipoprotein e(P4) family [Bacteroidales bacterium]HOY37799.1 5'-nucleotidase, lipoprotein e(P4) family [Bacteroidales bacterium]HQP03583.1 5'-nucleotidase, lipoprotein e(P4) family [Bacteroidales bacterium]
MKKFTSFLVLAGFSIIIACNKPVQPVQENKQESKNTGEHLHMALLWYQRSAEMTACSYQAYNVAKSALLNNIKNDTSKLPKAVILDIDETLLDNSPFLAERSVRGEDFSPEAWAEWSEMEKATALPGAVDFIKFALDNGVEVFYVSNRLTGELDWTLKNMASLGFPEVNKANFLLKSTTSDKKMRRDSISEKYSVVLFVGDNLCDFSNEFDDRSKNFGKDAVENNIDLFGTKYIIIPNPTYGTWEKPLYDKSETPKPEQRKKMLISYEDLKNDK